uniref:dihydropyrimidinase n=2 Tax=Kalanchoe fedtschenkoi TaxID=63787 RepID=A0A7N0RGM9_KALFE
MTEIADVLVIGGKIVRVGQRLLEKMRLDNFTRVINATGKYVMPGGIDPHTHLHFDVGGMVSHDDYLSGQSAALAGGTTMTMDFVMPTNGSYIKGLEAYFKNAEVAVTDYGFHAQIIFWNQTVSDELEIMVKEYGMNSFKFFQALDFMIRDDQMLEGFEKCKSLGAIAMLHAENGDSVTHEQKKLLALGVTSVKGHPLSRPPFVC